MTVAEVWGRVQGSDVLPLSHDGDDWLFPAPPGMSGTLICEFWAEDDAGNVGYRAAIITLDRGVIKCWRWLDIGCECIMRAQNRPVAEMTGRAVSSMTLMRVSIEDVTARPVCDLRPHVCPLAGEI